MTAFPSEKKGKTYRITSRILTCVFILKLRFSNVESPRQLERPETLTRLDN